VNRVVYSSAVKSLEAAEADGVGAYDMCVAHELRAAVTECVNRVRLKKAKGMILAATEDLYRIAIGVFSGSAGACTPKDAAQGTVKCFIKCGMDAKKTEECAKSKIFAIMC
jgi:hypothetical protein